LCGFTLKMFYKIKIIIQVLLGNTYCNHKGSYLQFNLMLFGCEHDTRATSLEEIRIFFYYKLQQIFNCKWHLQLKWLVIVLDKLHKTLPANDGVMMMSSHKQWMKCVFELTIFHLLTI
jgi:hypothetical protein